MVEKQFIGKNFKISYQGAFSAADFYDAISKWAHDNQYHLEIKDQSEHNLAEGKELLYSVEIYRHIDVQSIAMVRLHARFREVKDVIVQAGHRKVRMQNGKALIEIDGLIERHKLHAWENKPYIFFFRSWMDRFIHKNLFEQNFGEVSSATRSFYDAIRSFFHKEEQRMIA
jgi:hypothetical protein